ncbi:MAG: hypothetical protein U1F51_19665 [Burkholderiales bacterium]
MASWIHKARWTATGAWHALRERTLPWWPDGRLARLRDRRVRAIVAHAYATVPFYRESMDALGLRPSDIRGAADLAKLPIVGGAELAAAPRRFLSSRFDGRDTLMLDTTGTTGHYKRIHHDPRAVIVALAAGGRARAVETSATGPRRRGGLLMIVPPAGTNVAVTNFHRDHLLASLAHRLAPAVVPLDRPYADVVAQVNRLEPDAIATFGRFAGYLFRRASQTGAPIHRPRLLRVGGDVLPEADRRLIEERYGVPVFASYQSCEFLRIAFQCERREGYHVSTDQVALRIVDDDGRDVAPGTPGQVVVSGLVNRATVLLNYRLGDRATLSDARCGCGRTLPVLASIDGRSDDLLVRADGERVHESIVLRSLYGIAGLADVEVVQHAHDRVEARVVVGRESDVERVIVEAGRAITELLGSPANARIDITPAAEIAPGPGGKRRAVICRLAPGAAVGAVPPP